jgi:hypothetical protein
MKGSIDYFYALHKADILEIVKLNKMCNKLSSQQKQKNQG